MAVKCEFINIIINLESVDKKYQGGRKRFLKDFGNRLGKTDWHDNFLYRTGAMSPKDTMDVVKYLQTLGFEGIKTQEDGKKIWSNDLCVVDTVVGATLQCNWVVYDFEKQEALHIKEKS